VADGVVDKVFICCFKRTTKRLRDWGSLARGGILAQDR
jgi:hypothetical protein